MILAGNGVIRQGAADALVTFAEVLRIPVANTFMAKGVMPFTNELSLGTIGMKARDLPWFAFEKADVVICVGYDMVEYHPDMWNPTATRPSSTSTPSRRGGRNYIVSVGVLGTFPTSLRALALRAKPQTPRRSRRAQGDRRRPGGVRQGHAFPIKPQKIVWDLREVLGTRTTSPISDVGAHKMWMSRMYKAERPNTCIISNGFAAMGIAVPGALAAKLAYPDRKVVAVTGDAGFMMNSQGDRDRDPHEGRLSSSDLERLRVRADHLAPDAPLRTARATSRSRTRTSSSTPRASARRAIGSSAPRTLCRRCKKADRRRHRA
jgi:acetolactate synthase-1/2/3 large subunit